jgi:hypothetical protein
MKMKVRALLVAIVMLAEMWLVGCGHYNCGTTFGASSCSSGSGGLSQGSGGTTKGTYLLVADAGGIQGEVLDPTAKTIKITPGFGTVSVDTKVPGDWMVIAGQKFMYSAYTATGEIWGWSLNGNGTLTTLAGSPLTADFLLNDLSAGTQAMVANPAGTLLFALDQVGEAVEVYQIDAAGTLTGPSTTALPSGFKPFNVAVDGQGKYVYVSNISGLATTQVAVYSITGTTISAVSGSPFSSNLQQMQGEASGKFMIGTSGGIFFNNGDQNLYVGSVGQSGALTVAPIPTAGVPSSVAVQQNTGGNLVYAFDFPSSGGNGNIEGFTLDPSTGALSAIAGITATGANGEFNPNGKYLFVVAASNGVASALDAYDVSAGSALTSPLASVGWAPGAWQAFDTQ